MQNEGGRNYYPWETHHVKNALNFQIYNFLNLQLMDSSEKAPN